MVNSRTKGKRGELEVVHLLQNHDYNVRRGDAFRGEPDIVGLDGVHIEVKFRETTEIDKWMAQSMRDAEDKYEHDMIPTVWHKRNRMPLKVTLLAEDFLRIYEGYRRDLKGGDF